MKSQYEGITFYPARNHWRAFTRVNGRQTHIGSYLTEKEAYDARIKFLEGNRLTNAQLSKNQNRINRYKLILDNCHTAKNTNEMAEICTEFNVETITDDMRVLKQFNYLSKEMLEHGTYKQMTNYYTTLKPVFDINDLSDILSWIYSEKTRVRVIEEVQPANPNAKIWTTEKLAKKIFEQSKQSRIEKKSHKYYVSGSSLSSIF